MISGAARISSNGQVSIPAPVRRRWGTRDVIVFDRGDHVVIRPVPDKPVDAIVGKYAFIPPSEELRRQSRAEDEARESA